MDRITFYEKAAYKNAGLPNPHQVGVVVKNVEKTVKFYSSLGMGPFRVIEVNMSDVYAYGKPFSFHLKVGFAPMGSLQIEFIEPLKPDPIYQEFLDKCGEGLHHLAFMVSDLEQELEKLKKRGARIILQGGSFAYVEPADAGGVIFELVVKGSPKGVLMKEIDVGNLS